MHKPNEISIIIWSLQPTILYYQVKTLFDVTERCCSLELNLNLSEITQKYFLGKSRKETAKFKQRKLKYSILDCFQRQRGKK